MAISRKQSAVSCQLILFKSNSTSLAISRKQSAVSCQLILFKSTLTSMAISSQRSAVSLFYSKVLIASSP
ncbi:hypothetical protein [Moorena sp. SIO2C4]|uniref:Uncharacterized protein n=1 Tax=Moorena producens 3L TaxID=489825 RepID=F4XIS7_9CYAN|nr:hypothetical protein [Moorena sp. SIO2C4]EGJ35589.1 hypothetical protein LYNGBM3L_02990 [Moorena producens 3L]NES40691.1 hypothetical protein [Moorena sp. SIO2C4]OLT68935.1 hypothetical protein BI334_31490 [Moorena producens 3L]